MQIGARRRREVRLNARRWNVALARTVLSAEQLPQEAPGSCEACGQPLSEFRVRYCSRLCSKRAWETRNRDLQNARRRARWSPPEARAARSALRKALIPT